MSDEQSSVVTLKVRVSPEFREKIVNTAKQNNRSMNQEIVARLEESFNEVKKIFKITSTETTVRVSEEVFERMIKVLRDNDEHSITLNDSKKVKE
ncbi:Arc family DNA-binding protein [Acinetobacter sp. SWAC57]|uniref:Arc family DNA-binding protein n=1 Tax=Acinetobacter sp. SWAC57 TaxID=2293834 RepID=UPI000E5B23AE|nr:Arc family DNA-binding protein [Acinetobacter sp. SWAC57]RGD89558.1 Arc family DNA-binding protein [Acinetobacter sp. SWAC57]